MKNIEEYLSTFLVTHLSFVRFVVGQRPLLLGLEAIRLEAIAISNKTLLVAKGITTITRSKDATSSSWHRY